MLINSDEDFISLLKGRKLGEEEDETQETQISKIYNNSQNSFNRSAIDVKAKKSLKDIVGKTMDLKDTSSLGQASIASRLNASMIQKVKDAGLANQD